MRGQYSRCLRSCPRFVGGDAGASGFEPCDAAVFAAAVFDAAAGAAATAGAGIDDCASAETPARFFLCARCRTQVVICCRCDRGQIYCAGDCAQEARRRSRREAGRRYQRSRDGRFAHAERNRRYRVRRKNVTHQGSPPPPPDGLLASGSKAPEVAPLSSGQARLSGPAACPGRGLDLEQASGGLPGGLPGVSAAIGADAGFRSLSARTSCVALEPLAVSILTEEALEP